MYNLEELKKDAVSRRAFLTRMTMAGLGTAAVSLLAGCGGGETNSPQGGGNPTPTPSPSSSPGGSVLDPVNFPGIPGRSINEVVLNYALSLEILEADLYRQALNIASGRAATAALDSSVPSAGSTGSYTRSVSTGGISGSSATAGFLYLVQYAYVEAAHRDFLRTALGGLGAPVAPANPGGYTFPFGTSPTLESILNLIYAVEETGVRAYLGAAPFMDFSTSTGKSLVQTAVAIHSTEARHSGAIAYVLGKEVGPVYSIDGVTPGLRVTDTGSGPYPDPEDEDTFQYYSRPSVVLSAVAPFFA